MSRGSTIFADPIILPTSSPLKHKDMIHCVQTEETPQSPQKKPYTTEKIQSSPVKHVPTVIVPEPTKPAYYVFNEKVDVPSIVTMTVIILVTIFACPESLLNGADTLVSLHHVFYSGWITAVATGVGVIPFFFINEPSKFYTGLSNAIAAGMMVAASYSLITEAVYYQCDQRDFMDEWTFVDSAYITLLRTAIGVLLGLIFIFSTKMFLDQHEDLSLEAVVGNDTPTTTTTTTTTTASLSPTDDSSAPSTETKKEQHQSAQKMILIIIVMTLHSLSEGIGIGVSYGGRRGMQLGQFISLSLAVHNVPEGLAVGLVMKARNVSTLRTVLWAIFTSIPQPIFAIPAYLFIEKFAPMLPVGLGFAAGAMAYVACFELFGEAMEDLQSVSLTGAMTVVAFASMILLQGVVKDIHYVP